MRLSIAFDADGLDVRLFRRALLGWQLAGEARLNWSLPQENASFAETLQAVLRPTLLAWAVPPQTPVLVVPPAEVGGIVSFQQPGKLDHPVAACEKALASRLPFALRELAYVWRAAAGAQVTEVAIGWLPKSWIADSRSALARLGLRAEEYYCRAFLLGGAADAGEGRTAAGRVLLEANAKQLAGTLLAANRLPVAGFCLDRAADSLPGQLALAIHDFPAEPGVFARGLDEALSQVCRVRWPAQIIKPLPEVSLAERAFVRWHAGEAGIWIAPEPQWLVTRLTPWLIGVAVVALAGVVALSWQERKLDKSVKSLEVASDKIRLAYRMASARQRELFALQDTQGKIEQFQKNPPPLQVLGLLTDQLPEPSWLLHYHFKAGRTVAEGYGRSSQELLKAFENGPLQVQAKTPAVALDTALTPFALEFHDRPHQKPVAPAKPKPAPQAGT